MSFDKLLRLLFCDRSWNINRSYFWDGRNLFCHFWFERFDNFLFEHSCNFRLVKFADHESCFALRRVQCWYQKNCMNTTFTHTFVSKMAVELVGGCLKRLEEVFLHSVKFFVKSFLSLLAIFHLLCSVKTYFFCHSMLFFPHSDSFELTVAIVMLVTYWRTPLLLLSTSAKTIKSGGEIPLDKNLFLKYNGVAVIGWRQ